MDSDAPRLQSGGGWEYRRRRRKAEPKAGHPHFRCKVCENRYGKRRLVATKEGDKSHQTERAEYQGTTNNGYNR